VNLLAATAGVRWRVRGAGAARPWWPPRLCARAPAGGCRRRRRWCTWGRHHILWLSRAAV